MKLEHRFTVPASVPDVWSALLDPEKVAPCLPGAALTGVDGRRFTGTVKVKLGAVTLLYKGTGEFTVAKGIEQPFRVKAGNTDIVATGTAFTVMVADDAAVTVVVWICLVGLAVAAGMCLVRLVRGPSVPDRIVALDALLLVVVVVVVMVVSSPEDR